MQTPSRAADVLELAWDDVLRYEKVRSLTLGAAFVPALIVVFVDAQLLGFSDIVQPISLAGLVLIGLLVSRIFTPGRYRWRQEWPQPAK